MTSALDPAGFAPPSEDAALIASAARLAAAGKHLHAGLLLLSAIPIVADSIGAGSGRTLSAGATTLVIGAVRELDVGVFSARFGLDPALAPHIDGIAAALRVWQTGLAGSAGDKPAAAAAMPAFRFRGSSGAAPAPHPTGITTVLGSYQRDLRAFLRAHPVGPPDGDNPIRALGEPPDATLTAEQCWQQRGRPFLDQAITRGDRILLLTDPRHADVLFHPDGSLTGFGREIQYLIAAGYRYDADTACMVRQ